MEMINTGQVADTATLRKTFFAYINPSDVKAATDNDTLTAQFKKAYAMTRVYAVTSIALGIVCGSNLLLSIHNSMQSDVVAATASAGIGALSFIGMMFSSRRWQQKVDCSEAILDQAGAIDDSIDRAANRLYLEKKIRILPMDRDGHFVNVANYLIFRCK